MNTVAHPWPAAVVMLIVSSFFGGCVGSTSGAIKSMRVLLLGARSARDHAAHPPQRAALGAPGAGTACGGGAGGGHLRQPLPDQRRVFTLLLCFTGLDPVTAFGTTAGCLNNMGIGYGDTGGGFGGINDAAKWIMSVAMIWGRLEVLPVLVILSRSYWRH
jgi:trk system potassium uptake protein TrkH